MRTLLKYCFVFLFVFLFYGAYSQVNLYANYTGDGLWSTPGNWSLGHVPTPAEDASIAGNQIVTIPNGFVAQGHDVTSAQKLIIADGGELEVYYHLLIYSGDTVENNGLIHTFGSSQVIKNFGGILKNNNSILINAGTDESFVLSGGRLVNTGIIAISDCSTCFFITDSAPSRIKLENKVNGQIILTSPKFTGFLVRDSVLNEGEITLNNVSRDLVNLPNLPASGMVVQSFAFSKFLNKGNFTINGTSDYGIQNQNVVLNLPGGSIDLNNSFKYGIYNEGLFHNFGDMTFDCNTTISGSKALYNLSGSFTNKSGSTLTIYGNNVLETGIQASTILNNDSLATITINSTSMDAFNNVGGGVNNHGSIVITGVSNNLEYGLYCSSYFNNYGILDISYCNGGIYNSISFNNYGLLKFRNMTSKSIFSTNTLINHPNAIIDIKNNSTPPAGWGIIQTGETFTNNGTITIDSVQIGMEQRVSTIVNNNVITINRYDIGLYQFTFPISPPLFSNAGLLKFTNQFDPTGYAIYGDSQHPGVHTITNALNDSIIILNAFNGIYINRGGLLNNGKILGNQIAENFIISGYNTLGNHTDIMNSETGYIYFQNSNNGIYFNSATGATNHIPMINNGIYSGHQVANKMVTGQEPLLLFTNHDTIRGSGKIDCQFTILEGTLQPGNQNPGIITLENYTNTTLPDLYIDISGTNGAGQNNGHDGLIVDGNLSLTGSDLFVSLEANFNPMEGNSFPFILTQNGSITNDFGSISLPDLPDTLEWLVEYNVNSVVLKIERIKNYWTGSLSSNWNNAGNWSQNSIPDLNTIVVIPENTPNDIIIPANKRLCINDSNYPTAYKCKTLEVAAGANLNFQNSILTINDVLRCFGTIATLSSNTTIELGANGLLIIENGGHMNLFKN